MNFSELFKVTDQLTSFSPSGKLIACAVQNHLIIRDTCSLKVLEMFYCVDTIQHLEWSSDSLFIICGMYKRGIVQVWSLEQPDWTCKIDEGSVGLINVCWSPDGRHVLTTAEFHLRITVWSLVNKSVSYIKYPKPANPGLKFSPDGTYLALAERRNFKDCISIFCCEAWQLVKHFRCESQDLAGISWSPDGSVICVWDSSFEYKALLYSLDGRLLSTYSAYRWALGIKSVQWSPTSQFLALGSYDQKIRILNHITWHVIFEHPHPLNLTDPDCVVYSEVVSTMQGYIADLAIAEGQPIATESRYEVVESRPIIISNIKPDPNSPNPKIGVSVVKFSPDSRYLATWNDNMPTALWIWDMVNLYLKAVLIQTRPVKAVEWDPTQARLAICTGTRNVYFWTPLGCVSVAVPNEPYFQIYALSWHPEGNALTLIGKEYMSVCFLTAEKA